MIRVLCLLAVLFAPSFATAGEDYHAPARGSATRAALMDAIRPHVEWNLGQPVEFVVSELRVSNDIGFAILEPQRPGGKAIRLADTPMFRRLGGDVDMIDGTTVYVLYQLSGATWVAVHWAIGPTDVWWADPEFCVTFRAVTPEACY